MKGGGRGRCRPEALEDGPQTRQVGHHPRLSTCYLEERMVPMVTIYYGQGIVDQWG